MDVWDRALGFMDSQILLTAEELGVFEQLADGPSDVADVAAATHLGEDSATRLLTALCALELVERQPDGRYVNSREAAEKLVPGQPGYIGAMFDHVRDELYPLWGYFREALQDEGAQWKRAFPDGRSDGGGMYDDPKALRRFMEGMHAITYSAAAEFADAAPELEGIESLTDIGGASGAFAIALAEQIPSLQATVFDLPPVRPITTDFFRQHGVTDRMEFHAGDFWQDAIPAGADAYSLGFILHDWDTEGGSLLLERIAEASSPGALLIVGEYLLNEDRTGPHWVARSDLNMLVAARGRERSAEEYRIWLERYGFELESIYPTSDGKQFLVARRIDAPASPERPERATGERSSELTSSTAEAVS